MLAWLGLTLLFAQLPFFQRASLAERLRPYTPGATQRRTRVWAARSIREVIGPLASSIGGGLARLFGVHEDVRVRLDRINADDDATTFRVRQATWAVVGLLAFAALALVVHPPAFVTASGMWIAPLLAFLVTEQHLAVRSTRWQRRVELELPVVAEQLAMLLGAGLSLGAALNRVSKRGSGAIASDFRRLATRTSQGVSESTAIAEWSESAHVASVTRLAGILRLHGEATDLGRLVSDEARVCREEAQRRLIAAMERKSQQVWIPVTVAALLPGCIFLAVPFLSALRAFAQ